jgi:hypothetical protein
VWSGGEGNWTGPFLPVYREAGLRIWRVARENIFPALGAVQTPLRMTDAEASPEPPTELLVPSSLKPGRTSTKEGARPDAAAEADAKVRRCNAADGRSRDYLDCDAVLQGALRVLAVPNGERVRVRSQTRVHGAVLLGGEKLAALAPLETGQHLTEFVGVGLRSSTRTRGRSRRWNNPRPIPGRGSRHGADVQDYGPAEARSR